VRQCLYFTHVANSHVVLLSKCFEKGVWVWDCKYEEHVLVFPVVLKMLGNNPMASEFACHIGLQGRLFCRICFLGADEDLIDVLSRWIPTSLSQAMIPRVAEIFGVSEATVHDAIQAVKDAAKAKKEATKKAKATKVATATKAAADDQRSQSRSPVPEPEPEIEIERPPESEPEEEAGRKPGRGWQEAWKRLVKEHEHSPASCPHSEFHEGVSLSFTPF
jgi:hypothetical protein